jgi:hypothetical protein
MVNFIADEGDTVIVCLNVTNLAGIPTVVKIYDDVPDQFDVGYALVSAAVTHTGGAAGSSGAQLDNYLRKIDGEWVLFIGPNTSAKLCMYIWIKTKPPTPAGQYTIMTWIEQKFQE